MIKRIPLKYLLGLLNSKLLSWYFRKKFESAHVRGGYLQFKKQYTSQLPIKITSTIIQNNIIKLVDQIQSHYHELHNIYAKNSEEKLEIEEKIIKVDNKIDELIFSLYNLTIDEKEKIIKESKIMPSEI